MIRWELNKFRVEKIDKSDMKFEAKIAIPETRKDIIILYDGKQITVKGFEFRQSYLTYDIKSKLESLIESSLIKELSKHSRTEETIRAFSLNKISNYQDGTLANLRYTFNNKFVEFGSVLVIPPYKGPEKLCKVPLTVETNAVSSTKLFYDLLTEICKSAVRVNIDVKNVNDVLNYFMRSFLSS